MYTLSKHDQGNISFKYDKSMVFNIGFESISQVRHVQYNINPVSYNLRLKLSEPLIRKAKINSQQTHNEYKPQTVNVSDFVRLRKNVYLDTAAVLSIDKKNQKQRTYQKELAQELTYMIQLEKVNEQDFINLPFISSTNIVLPKSIRKETTDYILFDSIALYSEPESIDDFKNHLCKLCT